MEYKAVEWARSKWHGRGGPAAHLHWASLLVTVKLRVAVQLELHFPAPLRASGTIRLVLASEMSLQLMHFACCL